MQYRIFPAIGISRVGGDDDFFITSETPGVGPIEIADGAQVTRFKSSDFKKVRKQGARFHLFQSEDGMNWEAADLPSSATVTWTVTLHNNKAAVKRPSTPPTTPEIPQINPAADGMQIKAPSTSVSGTNQSSGDMQGQFKTTDNSGASFIETVSLGRLLTDDMGRLIVLGGNGFANAPEGTPIGSSYYKNPKWYDDVSDGPVGAKINLNDGSVPIDADGAWVIVAPPDFAPNVGGIVTLFDILRQIGTDLGDIPMPPAEPSFDLDILPLIERTKRHRWVHDNATWSNPALDHPDIRSKKPAEQNLRRAVRDRIEAVEGILEGHVLPAGPPYKLQDYQKVILSAYVDGNFDDRPMNFDGQPSAQDLTRASLESAVGAGFCPGIEAGVLMLDPAIYSKPFDFRIDHSKVGPGDLTALMAQPWQADFLKCHTEWWPSQRPDLAPQADGTIAQWIRGILGNEHLKLVNNYERLGFILDVDNDGVFVELQRDPSF